MTDVSQLRDLNRMRGEIRQFLRSGDPVQWYINKALCDPKGDSVNKAFALYYLQPCLSLGAVPGIDRKVAGDATPILEKELINQQSKIAESEKTGFVSNDITVLPNSYASAVLVAGYLSAADICNAKEAVEETLVWLTNRIVRPEGFIPTLYATADKKPSSYLTFWCAAALCEFQRHFKAGVLSNGAAPGDSLRLLVSWSGRRLRDMLAFHHGNLRSQFDIIETAYAAATLLMASDASDDRILLQHALSVLFESYFDYGCLKASAPVFTDPERMSVQLSTAEVLATIFLADRSNSILAPHLKSIRSSYEWLKDHGDPVRGWYPEGQSRANIANSYATASATLVLAHCTRMIDDLLDDEVRADMGISPFVQDPKLLNNVDFPGDLGPLLEQTVFEPILKGQRSIASYSMVLYGPPGTSKTTVAKLISQKLGWPFFKLDSGSFTQKGRAGIDQTAAEVFEKLGYVKRIVVLFDEVEELVQEREGQNTNMESRLLTTAMLPRLQELHDRQEIVFILATNRVENIDTAITRLGRFDIVRCVLPPHEAERKKILDKLVLDYELSETVKKYVHDRRVAKQSDRFCYGDLNAFVRELAVMQSTNQCSEDAMWEAFEHARSRAINNEVLKRYKESMDKYDRPRLRNVSS